MYFYYFCISKTKITNNGGVRQKKHETDVGIFCMCNVTSSFSIKK